MGDVKKVTCKECDNSWECPVGCGMSHGRLEAVVRLYPEEIQKEIVQKVGAERFPEYVFEYRMAACNECRSVVSVPVLQVGDHGRYIGRCPECGKSITVCKSPESFLCPVCRQNNWDVKTIGKWD